MLRIKDLFISYPQKENAHPWFLQIPMLQFEPGKIYALRGRNGSGKSSLLSAICNVIPEHIPANREGSIYLCDKELTSIPLNEMYRFIAYQMSEVSTQFLMPTLSLEISFALENMGLPKKEILQRLDDALQRFQLISKADSPANELSLGQQKIALLAVISALDAQLILLDEPSAALSDASFELLRVWLIEQRDLRKLIIVADHDPRIFYLADQILDMEQWCSK